MEYYRNVDIERDETIGEAQRDELDEFPEIIGGVDVLVPEPHAVLVTAGEGEDEIESEGEAADDNLDASVNFCCRTRSLARSSSTRMITARAA